MWAFYFSILILPFCRAFSPTRRKDQRCPTRTNTQEYGFRDAREPSEGSEVERSTVMTNDNSYLEWLSMKNKPQEAQEIEADSASESDVPNSTFTGVPNVAGKGNYNLRSLASTAKSSVAAVAKRGSGDLMATSKRARELAENGTNSAFGIAEKGVSGLQFFTREGSSRVGEVAQWIDSQAKMGTTQVGSKAKSLIQSFTGKDNYKFGDVTKELLRRIASQEVNMSDTILLLKILLAVGSFGPLAKALPFTVLLEALNVSLEQKIGGKVLEALAISLDDRLSAVFTADDKTKVGDAVKRSLLSGILAFTGKKSYESGDIQREVAKHEQEDTKHSTDQQLDIQIDPQFEEWDRSFRESFEQEELVALYSEGRNDAVDEESAKQMDIKVATELEEWNAMFKKKYADYGL